jgi:hypothetical protein
MTQSGGRLVQHVGGPAGRAALQLSGQLDALRLAAGQGGRGLAQAHVAKTHVNQRLQVPVDGGHRREEAGRFLDRHRQHLGDRLALVVHLEGVSVVPGAVTDLAGQYTSGRNCISILIVPSPAHASQRPPLTLKENRPGWQPRTFASMAWSNNVGSPFPKWSKPPSRRLDSSATSGPTSTPFRCYC